MGPGPELAPRRACEAKGGSGPSAIASHVAPDKAHAWPQRGHAGESHVAPDQGKLLQAGWCFARGPRCGWPLRHTWPRIRLTRGPSFARLVLHRRCLRASARRRGYAASAWLRRTVATHTRSHPTQLGGVSSAWRTCKSYGNTLVRTYVEGPSRSRRAHQLLSAGSQAVGEAFGGARHFGKRGTALASRSWQALGRPRRLRGPRPRAGGPPGLRSQGRQRAVDAPRCQRQGRRRGRRGIGAPRADAPGSAFTAAPQPSAVGSGELQLHYWCAVWAAGAGVTSGPR